MKANLLPALLAFFFLPIALGQGKDDLMALTSKAYLESDIHVLEKHLETLHLSDALPANIKDISNAHLLLQSVYSFKQEEGKYKENKKVLERLLSEMEEVDSLESYSYSLQSSLYFFEMGMNPSKGIYLAPRNASCINKALALDSTNAYAWKRQATRLFYTPQSFGGDKLQAVQCFQKSLEMFEAHEGNYECDWEFLETIVLLGMAYHQTGQLARAKENYLQILGFYPHFSWVKHELLPALETDLTKSQ